MEKSQPPISQTPEDHAERGIAGHVSPSSMQDMQVLKSSLVVTEPAASDESPNSNFGNALPNSEEAENDGSPLRVDMKTQFDSAETKKPPVSPQGKLRAL